MHMESDLSALEDRLKALLRFVEGLRVENADLRHQLTLIQEEHRSLLDCTATAKNRLEELLSRLPEDSL